MILSFEITMPNVGSWNGQWTGTKNAHFAFRTVTKQDVEKILESKPERSFYYNFGDGWGANVKVKVISSAEKRRIERVNSGFMGYNWMIDSIFKHGKIISE